MGVEIRSAVAADQTIIRRIVRAAQINPMGLDWRRFVVAEDQDPKGFVEPLHATALLQKPFGSIVGVGQVKPHGDGSRELASIAVIPERQGEGIASEIIRGLLGKETGTVYLTCRDALEGFYTRFAFRTIARDAMPPYFRRIHRLANILMPLMRPGARLLVMKRD
ncbi:MAG: GNAT family N-acetyltransferase [Chloroflexi bacterium]|nr:GNAT family N-acetyltransferase [Chloroflexota bacterium]